MGSTGSGRFSDYSQSQRNGNGSGGSSGTDQCDQAFSCSLEEVAQCDYYGENNDVPQVGAQLEIAYMGGRILALDEDGKSVGALPTSYNYLAACLEDGFDYVGRVTSSTVNTVPSVIADFSPR